MSNESIVNMKSSKKKYNLDDEDTFARFCFLPIQYPTLHSYYEKQRDSFWTAQELDFTSDRSDWESLDANTQHFLEFVLAFFAQADGIVIENLMGNFQEETGHIKEARNFYAMQNAIEVIHNEAYSMMIDAFISNPQKKAEALNAIKYYPSIKKIAQWMMEWMDTEKPLLERIVGFACVEGILFSGAFCAIYWVKTKHNKLAGLAKANEFIARDEALHTKFGVALYHHYVTELNCEKLSQKRIGEIIGSAMKIADDFIRDALKVDLIGLKTDEMVEYVRCTADHLSVSLGYDKIYNASNPFDWMLLIGMLTKNNFFESITTQYSKHTTGDFTFNLDEEF